MMEVRDSKARDARGIRSPTRGSHLVRGHSVHLRNRGLDCRCDASTERPRAQVDCGHHDRGHSIVVCLCPRLDALIAAGFNPGSEIWTNAERVSAQDGPWVDRLVFRTVNWIIAVLSWPMWGFQSAGMMVLSAWFWRRRFFSSDAASIALRRRVMGWGIGLRVCDPCQLLESHI